MLRKEKKTSNVLDIRGDAASMPKAGNVVCVANVHVLDGDGIDTQPAASDQAMHLRGAPCAHVTEGCGGVGCGNHEEGQHV